MDSHRKYHINKYAVGKSMISKSISKQKQTDKLESYVQAFLDSGGKVQKLASSLDNDVEIKVRHGEGSYF